MGAASRSGPDLLIVSPGNNQAIYQALAREYAAIETPIWAGMLAAHARARGFSVEIVDQEAQGLSVERIAERVADERPKLTAVVVYGQQPSASTQNMTVSHAICDAVHQRSPEQKTIMIGGHPSALPERTLSEGMVDFVCQGEGPATLDALLMVDDLDDRASLRKVPGLWFRRRGSVAEFARIPTDEPKISPDSNDDDRNSCEFRYDDFEFTFPAAMIPEADLPRELPGVAWDLLPMSAYRAHNWHCFAHIHDRQPYASIYTSLGCPYKCSFCCINAPFEKRTIRCWEPSFVLEQLDVLATKYGVKNVKVADEMFVLNERHVLELCEGIIERGYDFNFWAYARVDTVKEKFLEKLKKAGFHWLCLGIESSSRHVRDGVAKGRYGEAEIVDTVRRIRDAGIHVIGNYIFGLPDDDYDSMQSTLDLALDLNCEMANFYSGMAYPGSDLYRMAVERGWELPAEWKDFSQHSYSALPLPTEHLAAGEVLGFRDSAWQKYFTSPRYLEMLRETFGRDVVEHVTRLTEIKLDRKHAIPFDERVPHGPQPVGF
ncbi:MAG: cobalamin-dependent protein [Planctomycetaceae bacterium]